MNRQPICATCRFWWAYTGKGEGTGNCHRRSPAPASEALTAILGIVRFRDALFERSPHESSSGAPVADVYDRQAVWPMTLSADGCGEHVSRDDRQDFV